MTITTKQIILAIISLIIIIIIWTRKSWGTGAKVIYSLIYIVLGYFVYTKILYPGNTDALGNSLDRTTGLSY